jgi:hypothetical protein
MEDLMTCISCSQKYNLNERYPVLVIPCHDTICKQCYIKFEEPQNKVQCPVCNENIQFNNIQSIIQNKAIAKLITVNLGPSFYCKDHKNKELEFYCEKDNVFTCS